MGVVNCGRDPTGLADPASSDHPGPAPREKSEHCRADRRCVGQPGRAWQPRLPRGEAGSETVRWTFAPKNAAPMARLGDGRDRRGSASTCRGTNRATKAHRNRHVIRKTRRFSGQVSVLSPVQRTGQRPNRPHGAGASRPPLGSGATLCSGELGAFVLRTGQPWRVRTPIPSPRAFIACTAATLAAAVVK